MGGARRTGILCKISDEFPRLLYTGSFPPGCQYYRGRLPSGEEGIELYLGRTWNRNWKIVPAATSKKFTPATQASILQSL